MSPLLLALFLIQDTPSSPGAPAPKVDDARTSIQRAAAWFSRNQNADGSFGSGVIDSVQFTGFAVETYYCFHLAANSLAFCALNSLGSTPQRDQELEQLLSWLTSTRMPKRGNDWDVDASWPAVYGLHAMTVAAADKRWSSTAWQERIRARGMQFYELLAKHQEPLGGWGYYEGPVVSRRPTWSTSFTTGAAVLGLVRAQELGWKVDPAVIARAQRYMRLCYLPSGAYTYDHTPIPRVGGEIINDVKGSLSRMQVCSLALARSGDPTLTPERIRSALGAFFEHHRFLDVARMKPIPHEAYYQVAAYFYFFGHAYCGQLINLLPEAERESWHQKLRAQVIKVQWEDGSSIDFPNMKSMQVAGTAFSMLALQAGVPGTSPW